MSTIRRAEMIRRFPGATKDFKVRMDLTEGRFVVGSSRARERFMAHLRTEDFDAANTKFDALIQEGASEGFTMWLAPSPALRYRFRFVAGKHGRPAALKLLELHRVHDGIADAIDRLKGTGRVLHVPETFEHLYLLVELAGRGHGTLEKDGAQLLPWALTRLAETFPANQRHVVALMDERQTHEPTEIHFAAMGCTDVGSALAL